MNSPENARVLCSNCNKTFNVSQIAQQRGSGFSAQIQCPHCEAWLGKTPWLLKLKLAGFYLGVAAAICAWLIPETRHFGIPVAILGLIVLLISHLMDHLHTVEAPVKVEEDDSAQRQKYR
nr:hypothetical protein [Shewanella indica]